MAIVNPRTKRLGRVAKWLATCARKQKVPGPNPPAAMWRGEASAVIARLMSKCL